MICRLPLIAVLALLSACGGDEAAKDKRTATGEVLPGTISDEMIQLDSLTSTAPAAGPAAKSGPKQAAAADGMQSDAATTEPAPTQTPTPGFSGAGNAQ